MKLRTVEEIPMGARVMMRIDGDLPMDKGVVSDNSRLKKSIPTIRLLLDRNCKIAIMAHRGRPKGREEELSLRQVYLELMSVLESGVNVVDSVFIESLEDSERLKIAQETNSITFIENLRFWEGEEKNDDGFLANLRSLFPVYVNDAFAVAHRKHASIMLWQKMETYYGLSFAEEAEMTAKILENPQRPITVVLGGAKEDKLGYLNDLTKMADQVLVGGKLPKMIHDSGFKIHDEDKTRVVVAGLREDGLDLGEDDIKKFKEIVQQSRMVVWIGAMGYYESVDCRRGTEEIARAVAAVDGFKIIAGGDTLASVLGLGLKDKIDFVGSGGGVLLEYLTKGKLPAWG